MICEQSIIDLLDSEDAMRAAKYIKELQATSSRTEKEAIFKEAWHDQVYSLFLGFRFAYDKLVTFGVKQVPEKEPGDNVDDLQCCDFLQLLTDLSERKLTGLAANGAIHLAMDKASSDTWNLFYRNVLLKDMKCGASESTANKVLKAIGKKDKQALDFMTPVFSCKLAHDGLKNETKMTGKKLLDFKLDGVRLLTYVNPHTEEITQYTRNGRVNKNFPALCELFKTTVIANISEPMFFDGEVVSENFQALMKQVNRQTDVDTTDAVLALFDMIPAKDFLKGKYNVDQLQRRKDLEETLQLAVVIPDCITVVDYIEVDMDTPDGYAEYLEYNKKAIDLGYEGIMLKDPDAPYECKRSYAWLKQKPFIEVDLTVLDWKPGKEGKWENMFGSLICEGIHDGVLLRVDVGGFTDAKRMEIWNDMENVLGQVITVRADAMTQNQDKDWSLRFPRFRHFRSIDGAKGVKD